MDRWAFRKGHLVKDLAELLPLRRMNYDSVTHFKCASMTWTRIPIWNCEKKKGIEKMPFEIITILGSTNIISLGGRCGISDGCPVMVIIVIMTKIEAQKVVRKTEWKSQVKSKEAFGRMHFLYRTNLSLLCEKEKSLSSGKLQIFLPTGDINCGIT